MWFTMDDDEKRKIEKILMLTCFFVSREAADSRTLPPSGRGQSVLGAHHQEGTKVIFYILLYVICFISAHHQEGTKVIFYTISLPNTKSYNFEYF